MTAEVLELIEELKQEGRDLLLVTHEMGFARRVADRLVFMDRGEIIEQGVPDQMFDDPRTDRIHNRWGRGRACRPDRSHTFVSLPCRPPSTIELLWSDTVRPSY